MTGHLASSQAGGKFRVIRSDGSVELMDPEAFAIFMDGQTALIEAEVWGPERLTPPDGYDDPPIDLDAEGRTRDETMASQAAAVVVQRWRDEGGTWRYVAHAAFHRWPHLRTEAHVRSPSNQLVGMNLCRDFGIRDDIGP